MIEQRKRSIPSIVRLDETTVTTSMCEHCSTDFMINQTRTKLDNISRQSNYVKYRWFVILLIGPILGLVIVLISMTYLIRFLQHYSRSYSMRQSSTSLAYPSSRTHRSSTLITITDMSHTSPIVSEHSKSLLSDSIDNEQQHSFNQSQTIDIHTESFSLTTISIDNTNE
jgi:hypothetical protein